MSWKEKAEIWISYKLMDPELREILLELVNNENELEDSFYKDLEFGTGGIRGQLGPGTNRLNIYTVRKAAKGLADYIVSQGCEAIKRGVVIAFDSRHKSSEFALEVAKTVGAQGIKVYLFNELGPTPVLSFAVRYLNAFAGVVITASHNPPEYNGLKVYGCDGGQIPPKTAGEITKFIERIENALTVEVTDEIELLNRNLLTYIGKEIDSAYLENLKAIQLKPETINKAKDIKIVFTPLHGTANKLVYEGLKIFGFKNIIVVKEQELPDPDFPTVKSPNPEEHASFEIALKYAEQNDADILMATDPDADRLGVAVKNEYGNYVILTGNQIGALMLHYILTQRKENGDIPENGIVLKTIVTSDIGRAIANEFGIKTIDTLTGFKYIGEKIKDFEHTKQHKFIFGYEESYGYLISDFVRDKDAIQSAVFIAEVAAYYKINGKSIMEGLHEIYKKYGFYKESLKSLKLKGKKGSMQIKKILSSFRKDHPNEIANIQISALEDFQSSIRINLLTGEESVIDLPKSNVLKFYLTNNSWFSIRPSGTEPKIKFYFSVISSSMGESEDLLLKIENEVMEIVEKITK
ncbi:phospho-sugar mutase [Cytobacillus firmus]|uniref:phospho-sugar mutase n=1 Tax=Cytobacillus firmus TaxID=1399 RepID=UPI002162D290|nr:phospho-sugar mutase [Cytobacillus firmus]MCS0673881.1 phospho-sugar mutase [Cytobacillus firmus]